MNNAKLTGVNQFSLSGLAPAAANHFDDIPRSTYIHRSPVRPSASPSVFLQDSLMGPISLRLVQIIPRLHFPSEVKRRSQKPTAS